MSSLPAIAVKVTGDSKTGPIAVTWASMETCPSDCPYLFKVDPATGELIPGDCYTLNYPAAFTTNRLNKSPIKDLIKIALCEAAGIDSLPGDRDLRVHVLGDCPTDETALIVSSAMLRYQARSGFLAYTYTHAWRVVSIKSWQGANVLASCENVTDVRAARKRGYAAAIVVQDFPSEKVYQLDGEDIAPCPHATRGIKCVDCGLCFDSGKLFDLGLTIGLKASGKLKVA